MVLAPQPFVDVRGTPMSNLSLTRALADAGHVVDVITYPLGKVDSYPGMIVHRCRSVPFVRNICIGFSVAKVLLDINLLAEAYRVLGSHEFDAIHAVEEGIFIAIPLARRMRIPVVYDMDSVISHDMAAHAIGRFKPAARFIRRAERWAIDNSNLIITITPAMAEHVKNLNPYANVVIVPDIPLPMPDEGADPDKGRRLLPWDLPQGCRLVIYSGSFAGYQGLDLLVYSMAIVGKLRADVMLVMAGGDESEIRRLRLLASDLGVAQKVRFLGKIPSNEIPHLISAADILISPRRTGTNPPAKIYTYMQAGKPIVATDIPAHTPVLSRDSSVICPPTSDGLAQGILWVLDHPAESAVLADRARELVAGMTPESQAKQILEAYDRLFQNALN